MPATEHQNGILAAAEAREAPLALEELEIELLDALDGQIQATFAVTVAPLQERLSSRVRKIEQRLGLMEGAIGRTHHREGNAIVHGPPMPAPQGGIPR